MKATIHQEKLRIQIDNILPQLSSEGIDFTLVTERIANDSKRKIIENTLEMARGNKTEAARRLGISRCMNLFVLLDASSLSCFQKDLDWVNSGKGFPC